MGARPEDYAVSAPFKSYIHVDDFEDAKGLAEYLHKLDQDDQLYNEYFKWKVCTLYSSRLETLVAGKRLDGRPHSYPFKKKRLKFFSTTLMTWELM